LLVFKDAHLGLGEGQEKVVGERGVRVMAERGKEVGLQTKWAKRSIKYFGAD